MGSRPLPPDVRVLPGQVVDDGSGGLAVNVNGATPAVAWPGTYIPTLGDAVLVQVLDGRATVLGPIASEPRPMYGTVSGSASGGYVPVDTTIGTVQARYAGTAPAASTVVFLNWEATVPRLLSNSAVASTSSSTDTPTAPEPPPGAPSTGTLTMTALDSATWNATDGVWTGYYGTKVVQGSWSSVVLRGAWFYGSQAQAIAGKTVTAARIRLGARLHIGSYNSALSLQTYHHTSGTRPAGDVTRDAGPAAISLAVNAPAGWYSLDLTLAGLLVSAGGGIGFSGGSYGGVYGVGDDPASGQIELDWTD